MSSAGVAAQARAAGRRALRDAIPFAPFALLFAAVLALPLWTLVDYAFEDGLTHWRAFLDDKTQVDAVVRTFVIAAQTTLICGVLSYAYVGGMLAVGPRLRALLLLAALVPFLTSILVRTYGWIVLLGNQGPITEIYRDVTGSDATNPFIYNRIGVLVGLVHVLMPLFVLPLYAVMADIPSNLRRAARSLGANRVEAWLRVDLPLSLPGAAAGGLLVFITSLGFFITPALLGGPGDRMVAQEIDHLKGDLDLSGAAVLSLVLLGAVLVCVLVFRLFYPVERLLIQSGPVGGGRRRSLRLPRPSRRFALVARVRRHATGWLARLPWSSLAVASAAALALFFLAPLAIVVPVSFTGESFLHFPPDSLSLRWYESVLSDSSWRLALGNSLLVGLVGTGLAAAAGIPLAFALVRGRSGRIVRSAAGFAAMLPAVFPIVVLALAVFGWYLEFQLLGSRLPVGVAHAVLGVPFVVVLIMASLRDFDVRLEWAARSLGASSLTTFRRVTFPLIRRAVWAGMLFAFLISFDELLIARAVTSPDTLTLPVKIWNGATESVSPLLGAVSVLFVGLALLGVAAMWAVGRARARVKGARVQEGEAC